MGTTDTELAGGATVTAGTASEADEKGGEASKADSIKEEVPAEIKAFLEAVKALPVPEKVTAENAKEISGQVKEALALKEKLSNEYKEREDVKAALDKADQVNEAVLEVENTEPGKTTKTEETKSDETVKDEEQPKPGEAPVKEEEVPEEVKAFLDAVAELPAAKDVTKENAEEIGEQVNAVIKMAEALDDDIYLSKEVQDALDNTVYVLMEAVLAAEEIDGNYLSNEKTTGVIKTAFHALVGNTRTGNACSGGRGKSRSKYRG